MSLIISGSDFFKTGKSHFDSSTKSEELMARVSIFAQKAGRIQSFHVEGSPNNSRESTVVGASSASKNFIENMCETSLVHQRNDDNFFGENFKEAFCRIKKFFC